MVTMVYWQAPAVMISSLVAGLVFSIVHDRYYHHYDRQSVGSDLQQKVIVDVGTTCAFLVKMFYTISTTTAFTQQLWLSLRHQAESIDDIDALFDILSNALNFRKITLWTRHWVLALVALLVWCLPIATVFTPGTIHVEPALLFNNMQLKVAQPQQEWIGEQNFASTQLDFTATWRISNESDLVYNDVINNGPSGSLNSVAMGSISQRDILPIHAPTMNSTYDLSFYGPALKCFDVNGSNFSAFNDSFTAAYKAHFIPGMSTILGGVELGGNDASLVLKYNAWVSGSPKLSSSGAMIGSYNLTIPFWNNDTTEDGAATQSTSANTNYLYFSSSNAHPKSAILLACHMYNASYTTNFSFEGAQQTVKVTSLEIHDPVPYNGTVASLNGGNYSDIDYGNIVYNAIFTAFNEAIIGAAINDTGTAAPNVIYYGVGFVSTSALRDFIEASADIKFDKGEIIGVLEAMFENITLSTLSSASLIIPPIEAREVNGTTWRTTNIYVYEPKDLYIAYGCALLATSICVIWGLFVLYFRNHTSYKMAFSTILRTTRNKDINGIVESKATRGDDPLPRDLLKRKLEYHDEKHPEEQNGEAWMSGFAIAGETIGRGRARGEAAAAAATPVQRKSSPAPQPIHPQADTTSPPRSSRH